MRVGSDGYPHDHRRNTSTSNPSCDTSAKEPRFRLTICSSMRCHRYAVVGIMGTLLLEHRTSSICSISEKLYTSRRGVSFTGDRHPYLPLSDLKYALRRPLREQHLHACPLKQPQNLPFVGRKKKYLALSLPEATSRNKMGRCGLLLQRQNRSASVSITLHIYPLVLR